jgi:hypothetical protein
MRQAAPTVPAADPPKSATTPRTDQPRQQVPRDNQQKKVWKVTTPENAPEKESRGSEPKGNDNRGKERKEK